MMRGTLAALLGLAVLGAVFAAVYYDPDNVELKEDGVPAFNAAPGEVRSFGIQPSLPGAPILVEAEVTSGVVDIYIMDKEWAQALPVPGEGRLGLDQPFAFHAAHSATNVRGTFQTTVVSDGETWLTLVIDNSDNHYDGDAVPEGNVTAQVAIKTRYLDEEDRSLLLGYVAAAPSVILVVLTVARQLQRRRAGRAEPKRRR